MENEEALKKFNEELQQSNIDQPIPGMQTQQNVYSNVDPKIANQMQIAEQKIEQNMMAGPPPDSSVPTTFGRCPDCGLMHPPLPHGQKCPSAPVQNKQTGEEVDLSQFLGQLRTIAVSQIASKGIKDPKKMLAHIIVKVTQEMENYTE